MASKALKSIDPADTPQANAQTRMILDAVDELRQMIEAQGNALLEFSGRYDRRFPGPGPSIDNGTHVADMIRAERVLPMIYQVMQDEIFSTTSLVNSVMAAQHEPLAVEIDEFHGNNRKIGNWFSRIEGHAIPNGLALQRMSLVQDKPQLWKVAVVVKL